jgi:hypothetical protein
MPLPKPQADEAKETFLHRCMGDEVMIGDYTDEQQRFAVCNKIWDKGVTMMEQLISIFKTGIHTDSQGRTREWGTADLDKIASSYNPAEHEAPIVIGHPKNNAPAFGWVEGVERKGEILFAKAKQLVPEFVDMVKQGLFKKRSISLYPDGSLRHIGFLGAMPPAVKGLPDVAFTAEEEGTVIEFADDTDKEKQKARAEKYNIGIKEGGNVTKPSEWADVADDDFLDPVNYRYPCPDADQTRTAASYWGKEKNQQQYGEAEREIMNARLEAKKKKFKIGEEGGTNMSLKDTLKKVFTQAVDKIPDEDLATEPRTFSEAEVKAQVEEAKKQAKAEGVAEGKKAVSAEFSEKQRELKKTELTAYVDGLIKGDGKKGRALAAAKKAGLVEFMATLGDEETVEFTEGEGATAKTVKKAPLAAMKAILETLPQDITYSEVATKEKDTTGGNAGDKLSKLAQEKMGKSREAGKEISFRDALDAVQVENPELAQEYLAELGGRA